MLVKKRIRESQFHFFGWTLFSLCSILFIIDSIVSGSPWGLAGSAIFLLGCIIFLIPSIRKPEAN